VRDATQARSRFGQGKVKAEYGQTCRRPLDGTYQEAGSGKKGSGSSRGPSADREPASGNGAWPLSGTWPLTGTWPEKGSRSGKGGWRGNAAGPENGARLGAGSALGRRPAQGNGSAGTGANEAAFGAGADGVVLSREYVEMWMANLTAAGDTLKEIFAQQAKPS